MLHFSLQIEIPALEINVGTFFVACPGQAYKYFNCRSEQRNCDIYSLKTDGPKVTILSSPCQTPRSNKKPATRNYFQISNDRNCRDFSSVTYLCQKPVIVNDKCRNNSTSLPVHSIYCSCSARYENECRWTGPPYWYAPVYSGPHFHDFKALFYFAQ